jgi:hypothetical protein
LQAQRFQQLGGVSCGHSPRTPLGIFHRAKDDARCCER